MRRFLSVIAVLLPLLAFVAAILEVRQLFDQGRGILGLMLMLGSLIVFAFIEGLILRFWLLPAWGNAVSECVYGGSYTPDQDAIVSLAARIRREHNRALLPDLERLVRLDPTRARGWMEWFSLLHEESRDDKGALEALLEGVRCVRDKEDKAMFLYRAARFCEQQLNNPSRAKDLYTEATQRFPRTSYGRQARAKLTS